MKKLLVLAVVLNVLILSSCGNTKMIQGKQYDTYGLFNKKTHKNPNIEYEVIIGNVIWSILLCETIVFPVYFVGFSLYQPIGEKGKVDFGVVK